MIVHGILAISSIVGVGRQAAYCSGSGWNVYGGGDKLKGGSNDSCVLEGKTV